MGNIVYGTTNQKKHTGTEYSGTSHHRIDQCHKRVFFHSDSSCWWWLWRLSSQIGVPSPSTASPQRESLSGESHDESEVGDHLRKDHRQVSLMITLISLWETVITKEKEHCQVSHIICLGNLVITEERIIVRSVI
jgi:hypothetical protein